MARAADEGLRRGTPIGCDVLIVLGRKAPTF
jgi:hypothetical protein